MRERRDRRRTPWIGRLPSKGLRPRSPGRGAQPRGHVKGTNRHNAELDLAGKHAPRIDRGGGNRNDLLVAALQIDGWRGAQLYRKALGARCAAPGQSSAPVWAISRRTKAATARSPLVLNSSRAFKPCSSQSNVTSAGICHVVQDQPMDPTGPLPGRAMALMQCCRGQRCAFLRNEAKSYTAWRPRRKRCASSLAPTERPTPRQYGDDKPNNENEALLRRARRFRDISQPPVEARANDDVARWPG